MGSLDPILIRIRNPDPDSQSGFGSKRAKWPREIENSNFSSFEVLDVLF
jgi:hypothetical protein